MDATTSFETVVWLFISVIALICVVWLVRAVWRLVVGVGGEVASTVYETGSSDTHFLLKVIITILFPPLLFLWIWKGFREASQEAEVVVADQGAEEQVHIETKRQENLDRWSGKIK